jgi:DNA polymerase-3 subunit epsilon
MSWTQQRIVAFDTETTGLNPFDGDKIVEFGAVELTVDEEFKVTGVKAHDFLFNPGIPIPRESTKITGIGDEHVANKPAFAEKAAEVRKLMEGAILVAHNLDFDLAFIRLELRACGLQWPDTVAEVDTLRLSQTKLTELRQFKLGIVADALEVPLDNAHRATDDAEACGRVFVEIARRKGAPSDLTEMIQWADAVSPPPDTGHIGMGNEGTPVFLEGPHQGQSVEAHPDHLQWMTMALVRKDGAWHKRYPESVHEWARRWLRARTAGRFRANPRGGGSQDWGLDPSPWRS